MGGALRLGHQENPKTLRTQSEENGGQDEVDDHPGIRVLVVRASRRKEEEPSAQGRDGEDQAETRQPVGGQQYKTRAILPALCAHSSLLEIVPSVEFPDRRASLRDASIRDRASRGNSTVVAHFWNRPCLPTNCRNAGGLFSTTFRRSATPPREGL